LVAGSPARMVRWESWASSSRWHFAAATKRRTCGRCFSRARAGKSVTLINNLLFYRGSVMATDPKAELANITAARRAALGQKVHVLDTFGNSSPRIAHLRKSYNPMSVLKADSPTIIEDAGLIADALVVRSGQEKDPHWDESAKNFIEGRRNRATRGGATFSPSAI
jgi:type IV secretory pathway TraG/TraD family ATPase VirD4